MRLPTPNPLVVFQKLDDGAVLFSPGTELYFGLNDVGAVVWQTLGSATSLDEVAAVLIAKYPDAPTGEVRGDIESLLRALVAEGLATDAGDAGPAA